MADVKNVFKEIDKALQADPSLTKGVEAVYEFQLDGDESTKYQLILKGKNSKTAEGAEESSDCTLHMSSDDFEKMARGELNGTQAFMSGRLKIKGNMGLALKLQDILASYNKQKS
ncbi:SCP2 sterol-binding domain-containing protein [Lentibacillus sp. CBA3610]|uniref:SCP2 sterol-binding domain-containing protein n=1 Tax=Lentibacillus sp. CBA3610 TaxID=2518176 RepID=UPI00159637D7|nr:SCP2 sterol-binding domain-containing protein [Lentibacillus sp. CBA3610]QKY68748.1 SCP2 sterol-binding domain-containing protein [Lentibacillus sp. CBA3610]